MNRRETILKLAKGEPTDTIPAAFFMHFDAAYQQGQAAVDKHLEFFRHTGMDLVKVQYEQKPPTGVTIAKPEDWANAPRVSEDYFETTIKIVEGLVKAAKSEAVVILTLYSPFMWARHVASDAVLTEHLKENPEAVKKGLAIMVENVLALVRGCKKVGVDGFYASTQGGEAFRFKDTDIFEKYIKPTDLAVWDELKSCTFNVLHVCDYEGSYEDLTPFLDYPGDVVNSSLHLGERTLSLKEVSQLFKRPFMGGLERKGTIATGTSEAVKREAEAVLTDAPSAFMLAADCTVPSETSWDNLKAAIEVAHGYKK